MEPRQGAQHMSVRPDVADALITVEKKQLYEQAGVPEYWIVDPAQRRAELYRLADGHCRIVPLESNRILRSLAIPGFYLDVEWLFADPLPRGRDLMREILGPES